jgi:hypothetical protein
MVNKVWDSCLTTVANGHTLYRLYFQKGYVMINALMEQELLTLPDLLLPPVFSVVRVTRSLVLCVFFVDRCLYFFFWPVCCLFLFNIRILITPLVSSNSSYDKCKAGHNVIQYIPIHVSTRWSGLITALFYVTYYYIMRLICCLKDSLMISPLRNIKQHCFVYDIIF